MHFFLKLKHWELFLTLALPAAMTLIYLLRYILKPRFPIVADSSHAGAAAEYR